MSTSDYTYSTATELIAAMNDRAVSAVELADAAIERIERYDNGINAFPVRDFDRALDAARVADAAKAQGAGRAAPQGADDSQRIVQRRRASHDMGYLHR
jgi:amidase